MRSPTLRKAALAAAALTLGLATIAQAGGRYGDYAAVIREATPRADGISHVDNAALIGRLVELGVTTYAFLVDGSADFADLQTFLPAAAQAPFEVWAYLVPPTERPAAYAPCGGDYVCWGRTLGLLAKAYPNLTAFVMDDFDANVGTFTESYTAQMVTAARAQAPAMQFWAIDYYPHTLTDFAVGRYRGSIDGVIFPYKDLDSNAALPSELGSVCSLMRARKAGCLLMVYTIYASWHPAPPTPAIITGALSVGHDAMVAGKADGIITYKLDKSSTSTLFPLVRGLYAGWENPPVSPTGMTGGTGGGVAAPTDPQDPVTRQDGAAGCSLARHAGAGGCALLLALLSVLAPLLRTCRRRRGGDRAHFARQRRR